MLRKAGALGRRFRWCRPLPERTTEVGAKVKRRPNSEEGASKDVDTLFTARMCALLSNTGLGAQPIERDSPTPKGLLLHMFIARSERAVQADLELSALLPQSLHRDPTSLLMSPPNLNTGSSEHLPATPAGSNCPKCS